VDLDAFGPRGLAFAAAYAFMQVGRSLRLARLHGWDTGFEPANRRFAVIELGAADLAVGIDEGLLVNPPHALEIADIEGVLGAAVPRMLALELAMGLLLGLGLFQRNKLGFGQHQAVLGALGFQGFEPFVHGLQVVAQPHATHAGG
jgi:hypothetical protein